MNRRERRRKGERGPRAQPEPQVRRLTGRWTATAAAREARDLRREAIRLIPGETAAKLKLVQNCLGSISAGERVMAREGVPAAHRWGDAMAAMFDYTGIAGPHRSIEEAVERQLAAEVELLRHAPTYVIPPDVHAATVAAARSLRPRDLMLMQRDEDLPEPSGLLVLPEPMLLRSYGDSWRDVKAFTWGSCDALDPLLGEVVPGASIGTYMDAHGPIQSDGWRASMAEARRAGIPFPTLVPDDRNFIPGNRIANLLPEEKLADWERRLAESTGMFVEENLRTPDRDRTVRVHGEAARTPEGGVVGSYTAGEVVEDDDGTFVRRYMFALWRICAQRMSETVTPREAERGLAAPEVPARDRDPEDVRVVRLTRRERPGGAGTTEQGGREFRHRWMVTMHPVRQWYPSEGVHRVLFRGPFIKGPEGAPLLDPHGRARTVR